MCVCAGHSVGPSNLESGKIFLYCFFDNFFLPCSLVSLEIGLPEQILFLSFIFSIIYTFDFFILLWGDLFDLTFYFLLTEKF